MDDFSDLLEVVKPPPAPKEPVGAPVGKDDFSDLLEDPRKAINGHAAAVTTANAYADPAHEAQAASVGRQVGMPQSVVSDNLDLYKTQSISDRNTAVLNGSPKLAGWVSANPDSAKIARDDYGFLGDIEKTIGKMLAYSMGATPSGGFVGDIKASPYRAAKVYSSAKQAVVDVLQPWVSFLNTEQGKQFAGLSEYYKQQAQSFKAQAEAISPSGNQAFGVSSGVQSLLQNAKYMPLALLPGGQPFALGGMIAETFGESYGNAVEKNLPLWKALSYAGADAAVELWTEISPLGALIKQIKIGSPLGTLIRKALPSELLGEQKATLLQDLNEWATIHPEKPFSDYLKERPGAAAETLIATLVGFGGQTAIGKAADVSFRKISDAYVAHANDEYQKYAAKEASNHLQNILTLIDQTNLKNSPEDLKVALDHLAPDSDLRFDARNLADTLQQSGMSQEQIDAALPSLKDKLTDALTPNTEVSVPLSEWVTGVRGTTLEQSLLQIARIGDNELSASEATQSVEKSQELLKQSSERVMGQAEDSAKARLSSETVRNTIKEQLNALGTYSKSVNDVLATAFGSYYTSQAGRTGKTVEQFYKEHTVKFLAGEQIKKSSEVLKDSPEYKQSRDEVVTLRKRDNVLEQLIGCLHG